MIRNALLVFATLAQPALCRTSETPTAVEGPGAAQGVLVARTYDLDALAPRTHPAAFIERVTPLLTEFDEASDELESDSGADAIASVLLLALDSEFDAPGRELRIEDSARLRVVAPESVHAEVVRVLSFLESALGRAVDVRLDFVELPADAPVQGGLVPAAEAERRIASGVTRSFSLHVPAGRVGVLDATQHRRFIGGYEVEIAEAAAQHYPRMETLSSGARCAVRAAAVNGGVQLALYSSDVELAALRTSEFPIGALLAGDQGPQQIVASVQVELPTLLSECGGFNLFVPDGQALVLDSSLALRSGARRQSLVVRCSPSGPAPAFALDLPSSGARLELLDATWRLPPRAEFNGVESGFEFVGESRPMEWRDGAPTIDVALEAPVFTELQARLAENVDELASMGPWILALRRKGGAQGGLQFETTALAPVWAPSSAQLSWTLRRKGPRPEVLAAGGLSLALGSTSAWVVGAESRVLTYGDVEIASKAAVIGPRVGSALDGLVFWARPMRTLDGGIRCEVAVSASILSAALEETSVGAPLRSVVERGAWDALRAHPTLYAPVGGAGRKYTFPGGGGLELELELR